MGVSISLDRNADIRIEGRIQINVDPQPPPPQGQVRLSATCDRFTSTHTGATAIMYTLPADKNVDLKIEYTDKNGNLAQVDGEVTWESSDEEICTVEPTVGQEVTLKPGTKVGNAQIGAKADADLGEGVRELVTLLDVTVVGGEAVAGTITPVGEAYPAS